MSTNKKEISVYFANWHLGTLPAAQAGEVAGIPWDRVTNIMHAFWAVAPADGTTETSFERRDRGEAPRTDFHIISMRPEFDLEDQTPSELDSSMPRNHFAEYEVYAKRYPNVDIMLSIGGWARCGFFSEMAYTREGRASFVHSCVEFLKKYHWMAGIDIDWEYPGCSTAGERLPDETATDGDQGCPIWGTVKEDADNCALLFAELRSAMDDAFGKGKKKLTACCAGSTTDILPLQDWAAAAPSLDRINIMSYDMSGVWDGKTGHATGFRDTIKAVDYFASIGVPTSKLCIGSPLYAIAYLLKGTVAKENVVGAPCETRRATDTPVTERECKAYEAQAVSGYIVKKDGCRWVKAEKFDKGGSGWHLAHDDEAGATYMYNDDENSPYYKWYLTYEDRLSLQEKLDYVNHTDVAGVIIWECDQDTEDYAMLTQMAENLLK